MERVARSAVVLMLVLGILGCGDDDPVVTKEPPKMIEPGLSGDTYMNTKFGVKIENIPTEGWTVKALGKDGQGFLAQTGQGFMPIYRLLLMEPVPADQFVEYDQGLISPILEAGIPFIYVSLDYNKGGSFETHNLTEELESYAIMHSAEIESKKMVGVGKDTGIQAVLIRSGDLKEALTWFAKGEVRVRCEYWAEESEFHIGFITYQQISQSITLMGK
jgi:hypothetical protein